MGARAPLEQLTALGQMFRLPLFGVTLVFPTVGATAGPQALNAGAFGEVVILALLFHCSVYGLNNIIDATLDSTAQGRLGQVSLADYMSKRVAIAISGALGVLAVLWVDSLQGRIAYLAALACLWLYDVFGKRCPMPWAMDLLQGLGWAFLLLTGASMASSVPVSAWLAGLWAVAAISLANGGHGALRDVENDFAHGRLTTATILLRTELQGSRLCAIPVGYARTILFLNAAQGLLCVLAVAAAQAGFWSRLTGVILVTAIQMGAARILAMAIHRFATRSGYDFLGMIHLILVLAAICVLPLVTQHALVGVFLILAMPGLWLTARRARQVVRTRGI